MRRISLSLIVALALGLFFIATFAGQCNSSAATATAPPAAATAQPTVLNEETPQSVSSGGKAQGESEGGEGQTGGPSPQAGGVNPYTPSDAAAVSAGKTIYEANCLSCHGVNGDGKGPASAGQNPPPSSFVAEAGEFGGEWTEKLSAVRDGISGTSMPAFKGKLSDDQIWQVLTYIWSLVGGK
jgi:mono/diheme cytochrome c family protein